MADSITVPVQHRRPDPEECYLMTEWEARRLHTFLLECGYIDTERHMAIHMLFTNIDTFLRIRDQIRKAETEAAL